MFEAMQFEQTPLWVALLNPLIGALGVLVGGRALARGDAHARPADLDSKVRLGRS
jgi:hypothetical protein